MCLCLSCMLFGGILFVVFVVWCCVVFVVLVGGVVRVLVTS